jgi:hypothetical protein
VCSPTSSRGDEGFVRPTASWMAPRRASDVRDPAENHRVIDEQLHWDQYTGARAGPMNMQQLLCKTLLKLLQ